MPNPDTVCTCSRVHMTSTWSGPSVELIALPSSALSSAIYRQTSACEHSQSEAETARKGKHLHKEIRSKQYDRHCTAVPSNRSRLGLAELRKILPRSL